KPFTIGRLAQTIANLLPHLTAEAAAGDQPPVEIAVAQEQSERASRHDTAPSLDLGVLAHLRQLQTMGKANFVYKVLSLYVEHAPAAVERIARSAASGRADECSNAAHALKSMSLNIGARRVTELALAIETAARIQHKLPSPGAVEELRHALHMTLQEIEHLDEVSGGGPAAPAGRKPGPPHWPPPAPPPGPGPAA